MPLIVSLQVSEQVHDVTNPPGVHGGDGLRLSGTFGVGRGAG